MINVLTSSFVAALAWAALGAAQVGPPLGCPADEAALLTLADAAEMVILADPRPPLQAPAGRTEAPLVERGGAALENRSTLSLQRYAATRVLKGEARPVLLPDGPRCGVEDPAMLLVLSGRTTLAIGVTGEDDPLLRAVEASFD